MKDNWLLYEDNHIIVVLKQLINKYNYNINIEEISNSSPSTITAPSSANRSPMQSTP